MLPVHQQEFLRRGMTSREAFRLNQNRSRKKINIPYAPNKIQGAKARGEVIDEMPTPVKLLQVENSVTQPLTKFDLLVYTPTFARENQKVSKSN